MTPREIALCVLAAAGLVVVVTFWRCHRDALLQFNALDLIMENGKVSKIALAFMVVLGVTTWIVAYLTLRDKMTEGYFTSYGLMWVAPLVAKVVFNKTDLPGTTSTTLMSQTTTEVTKP
jgi:hypothetical protein